MEYWKRIKLSNIDTIISKSLDYVMQNTHHMEKGKFRGPFISISNQEYLKHVPEIHEALREHKLFFEDVNIYMMWQNSDIMPHKDYTAAIGRINIPLLNCSGSHTIFYEGLKAKRLMLPTGNPFYATVNKDYKEVTRVEITEPTIVRVSQGHSVDMNVDLVPRITLTIATVPDAGLLLED
jgi:hypothetical protein